MEDKREVTGRALMDSFDTIDVPKAKADAIEAFGSVEMAMGHRKAHESLLKEWNSKKMDPEFMAVWFDDFVRDRVNGSAALRWQEFEEQNPDAAFFVEIQQKELDLYTEHKRIFDEIRVRPGEPGWRGR